MHISFSSENTSEEIDKNLDQLESYNPEKTDSSNTSENDLVGVSVALFETNLNPEQIARLSLALQNKPQVLEISINYQQIDPQIMQAIIKLIGENSQLRQLELNNCPITTAQAVAIAEALATNTNLQRLSLQKGGVKDQLVALNFAKSLSANKSCKYFYLHEDSYRYSGTYDDHMCISFVHGECLNVTISRADPAVLLELIDILSTQTLFEINIWDRKLRAEVFRDAHGVIIDRLEINHQTVASEHLNEILRYRIKTMLLNNCVLGEEDALSLANHLPDAHDLRKLIITGNPIGEHGFFRLAIAAARKSSLLDCEIFSDIGDYQANRLRYWKTPLFNAEFIYISRHELNSATGLIELLNTVPNLKYRALDLCKCSYSEESKKALLAHLAENSSLTTLKIFDDGLGNAGFRLAATVVRMKQLQGLQVYVPTFIEQGNHTLLSIFEPVIPQLRFLRQMDINASSRSAEAKINSLQNILADNYVLSDIKFCTLDGLSTYYAEDLGRIQRLNELVQTTLFNRYTMLNLWSTLTRQPVPAPEARKEKQTPPGALVFSRRSPGSAKYIPGDIVTRVFEMLVPGGINNVQRLKLT